MGQTLAGNIAISPKEALLRQKIHMASEKMATLHFGQFASSIMKAGSHDEENNQAKNAFGMFLAKGLGRGIARSAMGKPLVRNIENLMLRGAGLKETKTLPPSKAAKAYKLMALETKPNMRREVKGIK